MASDNRGKASENADTLYIKGMELLAKKPLREGKEKLDRASGEAFTCFSRAAKLGHADAFDALGRCDEYGLGCNVSWKNAVDQYQKAAALGAPHGMFNLGRMHYFGCCVPYDLEAGYRWFLRAAWEGDADAMCFLGDSHLRGRGTEEDRQAASEWYLRAAKAGSIAADYALLTEFTADGFDNVEAYRVRKPKFTTEAVRMAAEAGDIAAMVEFGSRYELGSDVKQDVRSAYRWYLAAAEKGNPMGMFGLVRLYDDPENRKYKPLSPGAFGKTAGDLLHRTAAMGIPAAVKKYLHSIQLAYAIVAAIENREEDPTS